MFKLKVQSSIHQRHATKNNELFLRNLIITTDATRFKKIVFHFMYSTFLVLKPKGYSNF